LWVAHVPSLAEIVLRCSRVCETVLLQGLREF
jgi:hypothetical protein